jgi:hypothetical protein
VAFTVVLGATLLAASAALAERQMRQAAWAVAGMLVAFGLGFAYAIVRTRRGRGPLAVMMVGSALGGLFFGLGVGALTFVYGSSQRGALTFLFLVAPAIAATILAPLCALGFAPILVVATRVVRAPSHDGPSVLLAITGAWGALVAGAVAVLGGNPLAWIVALAGLAIAGSGVTLRTRMADEVTRVRKGGIAGLALVSRAEATGLEGAERALPLLRGTGSGEAAWIASDAPGNDYREAPARMVLARVEAIDGPAPGLLRAAFAGARPAGWELAVLVTWSAAILAIFEFGLMRAHR